MIPTIKEFKCNLKMSMLFFTQDRSRLNNYIFNRIRHLMTEIYVKVFPEKSNIVPNWGSGICHCPQNYSTDETIAVDKHGVIELLHSTHKLCAKV